MSIYPASQRPAPWITYYDDGNIKVTSWFVQTGEASYLVADLHGVARHLTYTHPARSVALITGGIEMMLALPFAVGYHSALLLCVGVVAALGVGIGVLLDARQNPRGLELRAYYRYREVRLFHTRDKIAFEQVRRALIRAIEAHRNRLP
jgi:hypothetical protein